MPYGNVSNILFIPLLSLFLLMFLQRMCTVREVPLNVHSLDSSYVFILDLGMKFYVWCGKKCNEAEETEAIQYAQKLKVCM